MANPYFTLALKKGFGVDDSRTFDPFVLRLILVNLVILMIFLAHWLDYVATDMPTVERGKGVWFGGWMLRGRFSVAKFPPSAVGKPPSV